MRIIEKLEIIKFRSLGELETIETFDLNIFSGSNDSGKSNILKALNLFFNNQTDLDTNYNSEIDFNKWFRDNNERGQRVIEIKVQIAKGNYSDKNGINKGFIAKKIFRADGSKDSLFFTLDNKEIKQSELSHRKASAVIDEKIRFVYIPTVRDIKFRESVQRLIQEIANSTDKRSRSKDLKDAFLEMEKGIDSQLKDLSSYVKERMNVEIETNVNFGTLLESLTFETSEKIKIGKKGKVGLETQRVSLKNRGEGIQMQFFSFMLWFISKNDTRHNYIWGYEEPEIAFELKRQFEIVEIFENTFSKVAQIFVTTHSPAFAFAESSKYTKVFRVTYEIEQKSKKGRYISKVIPIDEYYEGLFKELTNSSQENKKSLERDIWGINVQKISKMIGDSMSDIIGTRHISSIQLAELKKSIIEQDEANKELQKNINIVEKKFDDLFPEKIFICEDEKGILLWENLLFEKLNLQKSNFKVISSRGCSNNEVEIAIMHLKKSKSGYNPKVFRQLDRDGFTVEQVNFLETTKSKHSQYSNFKKYNVKFLPVNEIENFALLIDPTFTDDMIKAQGWDLNNKITDAFRKTIDYNINVVLKICESDQEKNLFRDNAVGMLREARTNLIKYFPGKELKQAKSSFNPSKVLLLKSYEDYPNELKEYLDLIKDFFEVD